MIDGAYGLHILGVGELTRAVRDAVRGDERLRDVWVEGEVGRVTVSTAGHAYFALKDERAQLSCVMFREQLAASAFEPRTGLRIVAHGRIDVFEQGGVYQLYVDALQPSGFGDLALRFEALKARLAAEGLFDAARKRPLPVRPRVVAVVTSPIGAAWHDIRTVLARRWPLATVLFSPCQVQGDAAPASIVAALARVEAWVARCAEEGREAEAPSVTILARGGGSPEDLASFNDERVVRAVAAHGVPLVCGVGHEVDVTLSDFASDVRAPTPSAAAEMITPDRREIAGGLDARGRALTALLAERLAGWGREVAAERRALDGLAPEAQLAAARERAGLLLERAERRLQSELDARRRAAGRAGERLPEIVDSRLERAGSSLAAAAAGLSALDPAGTLARGYAVVRLAADGSVLRDPASAPRGTALTLDVAAGRLGATSDGPIAGDGGT